MGTLQILVDGKISAQIDAPCHLHWLLNPEPDWFQLVIQRIGRLVQQSFLPLSLDG
jgi:hypothetical protein